MGRSSKQSGPVRPESLSVLAEADAWNGVWGGYKAPTGTPDHRGGGILSCANLLQQSPKGVMMAQAPLALVEWALVSLHATRHLRASRGPTRLRVVLTNSLQSSNGTDLVRERA